MTQHPTMLLKQINAKTLLERQFQPRHHVIDPWLRTGETALIWAGSGVGKTMLTLSLALAIAGGGRVWEWSCGIPRKVLLIDGEMHLQDLQERLRLLGETAVAGLDYEEAGENLTIIARQDQKPLSTFFDVTDEDHQKALLRRCSDTKADVLIIDNLSTVADGLEDENEAVAFRTVQSFMLRMKQAGITTILVHHARKDGQEPRGSTALATTFEVILGLKKPSVPVHGKASFVASFSKFRAQGGASTTPRTWTLGDTGWAVEEDPEDELAATLKAIQSLHFATQKELAKHFGIGEPAVSKRIGRLVASGLITKEGVIDSLGRAKKLREAEASGDLTDFDPPEDTGVACADY
ncbi:MAG: AAA family ATPase [Rhizobiaceae bacterium]|nr:AAA family ATPase [Rhizobiaceae bacterium]